MTKEFSDVEINDYFLHAYGQVAEIALEIVLEKYFKLGTNLTWGQYVYLMSEQTRKQAEEDHEREIEAWLIAIADCRRIYALSGFEEEKYQKQGGNI